MKDYKCFIFDLDGTLLDTSEGILCAVKEVFKRNGLPEYDDEFIKSFIGPPIEHTFGTLDIDKSKVKGLAEEFRDTYFKNHLYEARIFENIPKLLEKCKTQNVYLGVATNKRESYTKELLEKFGLSNLFDVIHGTDEKGVLTKTDIINTCLSDLNVKPEDALMIGDAWSDEKGAEGANVDFAAAMYGFGFTEKSVINCVYRCYDPIELLSFARSEK